jgi:predicted HicB family RNase H-like nuclease
MIEYKGYVGIFEFEENNQLFRGRVTNIDDLVTFQGKSVKEIQETFKDAVDEYISWCKKYRKKGPQETHPLLKEKKNKNSTGGGGSN